MDFKQIEAFVHVVKHKSFSKAADAIFLTQPTISNHISSLENELGVKLIDRSGKEMQPTRAGKVFYTHALNMIHTRDGAILSINEYKNNMGGILEIAASTAPSQFVLPSLLIAFQKKYPKIAYVLSQKDSRETLDVIVENQSEIGFTGYITDDERLCFIPIVQDKLVFVAPPDREYEEMRPDSLSTHSFFKEPFIMREDGPGTRKVFEQFLTKHHMDSRKLNMVARMNSVEAVKQAVSKGLGVSVMSGMAASDYIEMGLMKAVALNDESLYRHFYMVTYRNRPLSPVSATFREFALQYFKT